MIIVSVKLNQSDLESGKILLKFETIRQAKSFVEITKLSHEVEAEQTKKLDL